jgi:cell wall-associated NlpC family hydrolase
MYKLTSHQKIIQEIVLEEAVSWHNTPYRNGCKEKGRGVDCAQLGSIPYKAAGIIPEKKIIPARGVTVVLDKDIDKNEFHDFIVRYAEPIMFDNRMPGDLVTFYNCGIEHHVGIILDNEKMIDATNASGVGRVRIRRILKLKSLCAVYRAYCLLDLTRSSDLVSKGKRQLKDAIGYISKQKALKWKLEHE